MTSNHNATLEAERSRAEDRLKAALRALAVNIMRIAAGSGKVDCLEEQFTEEQFTALIGSFVALEPHWGLKIPNHLLVQALSVNNERSGPLDEPVLQRAKEAIVARALQLYASRLSEQRTQVVLADSRLEAAIDRWNKHCERLGS